MSRACQHCGEDRDDVRARRTPDGPVGDLCGDCWHDVASQWAPTRDR